MSGAGRSAHSDPAGGARGRSLAAWILLVGVAAALRLWRIDFQSLWHDEIGTLMMIGRSYGETFEVVRSDVHPPLYFYCLRLWVDLFGDSETSVRGLSALFGAATLPLLYRLARRLFDARVAWLTALLFTFSLYQIYYAQEARSYALLCLLSVASMDAWTQWMKSGRPRHAAIYAAVTLALLYTHYFGIFALAVQAGFVLATGWRAGEGRRRLLRTMALQAGVLLLFTPWLLVLVEQTQRVRAAFWIPEPGLATLLRTPLLFVSLRRPPWGGSPFWEDIVLAFGALIVAVAGLMLTARGRRLVARIDSKPSSGESEFSAPLTLMIVWITLPVAAAFAASQLSIDVYTHRNLIMASPPVLLLLGLAIARVRNRTAAALLMCLALAPSLGQLPWYYGTPHKDQWRRAAAIFEELGRETDGVIFDAPRVRRDFEYYRGGGSYVWIDPRAEDAPERNRVWLIRSGSRGQFGDLAIQLVRWGYEREQAFKLARVDVLLFSRAESDPGSASP